MDTPQLPDLMVHILGSDLTFLSGTLPPDVRWSEVQVSEVWNLHPAEKHRIRMFTHVVETPRFQQAYGVGYHYTGRLNEALPVPAILEPLHDWARQSIDMRLNGLLLNWYDGPDHYIGPHHDSIRGLVSGTPIVTVSFGESRVFRLTQGKGKTQQSREFPAPHGTVFVMPWNTNLAWKHSVPKSARYRGRRISVTFRAFTTQLVTSMRA